MASLPYGIRNPSRLANTGMVFALTVAVGGALTHQLDAGLIVALLLTLSLLPLGRLAYRLVRPEVRIGAWWAGPTMTAFGFLAAAVVIARVAG